MARLSTNCLVREGQISCPRASGHVWAGWTCSGDQPTSLVEPGHDIAAVLQSVQAQGRTEARMWEMLWYP